MNDDMLSQEEINQLLAGIGSDDLENENKNEEPRIITSDFLSAIEEDALGEIGNISFGSAATALSTLLNQKVDITTPIVENEFPQPHVAVHVEYTEGFEGMNLLVIKTTDAAIIADLMMGGDGTSPAAIMDDMQLSAVQEAMNQMMGSASTSMSTIFNKRVDISPPGIDVMDVKNNEGIKNIPSDKHLVKISFRLKIGDLIDSSIMQLVTVGFAKELVNELMNPEPEQHEMNHPEPFASKEQQFEEQRQQSMATQQTPYQQPVVDQYQQQPMYSQQSAYLEQREYQQHQYQQPVEQVGFSESRNQQHLGSGFGQRTVDVQPAAFSNFDQSHLNQTEARNLNMLLDIPLQVTVELGRTKRSIKEILEFSQGSIIELDKLAGEPVDILVNQKLIAKGEVVVIDENFGVRVTSIVSPEERLKNLK